MEDVVRFQWNKECLIFIFHLYQEDHLRPSMRIVRTYRLWILNEQKRNLPTPTQIKAQNSMYNTNLPTPIQKHSSIIKFVDAPNSLKPPLKHTIVLH